MKKIITSDIATGLRMPFTKDALNHVQDSYKEIANSLASTVVADPNQVNILHGASFTAAGTVYTVTSGATFYKGEIYQVDAGTFNVTGSTVPVWKIDTSYPTSIGNPLKFYDASNPAGTLFNVLQVNKMYLTGATSGSGVQNYSSSPRVSKAETKNSGWIFINDTGSPAFQNGWGHLDDFNNLRYRKDNFGVVYISAVVSRSSNSNLPIITMPVGYRIASGSTFTFAVCPSVNGVVNIAANYDGEISVYKYYTGALASDGITIQISYPTDSSF